MTYETIRQWCYKFGQSFAKSLRRRQGRPGDTWFMDEVFIKIGGELHYLWRAVPTIDEYKQLLREPPLRRIIDD